MSQPLKRTKPAAPEPKTAASWSELARLLGVDRQSITRWRSRPDAPTAPDLDAWRGYVEENALGRASGADLADLKAQLLREQIERERRRNAVEARSVIPVEECVAAARTATSAWSFVLTAKLEQEAPARLVGKDIAETRAELTKIHDELVEAYAVELAKASVENPPPLSD